ncbi:MAG: transcriptional regulator NrdR [Spirochaetes bacterium GWD1_27_9]|nr:MAG: transcriptional regulator NrdR [Spirochaetes bacterium GWB1_27_13]OHD24317.1 MAG: transcriptional regulator NrdR [Spirochaetes bacterium GWC1_27_15]OHD37839.1 MAG: transcriptional regulator NrdR [Spirochaetes bacterium GWD1_27_9]
MKCPNCSCVEDKVLESRSIAGGISLRRRRECLSCGYRFTSYEHIEEKKLMVSKRDKRRELFNIEKLSTGIQKAFEKRPIPQSVIEDLINSIQEEAILEAGDSHEISSYQIGEMAIKKISKIDPIAYIRFASVYRKFEDVSEFIREIENIKNN